MRLSVSHATIYEFEAPIRFITQSHRLTPANSGSQRVLDWSVTAEGATYGASFTDGAGDLITTITLQGPIQRIEIVVTGTVETTDTAGVLRDYREIISPRVYLSETAATTATGALIELAETALTGADAADDLARAHRLAEAVAEAIAYTPGTTDASTTAAEALERGVGVCQDHTHVLVAVARASGLPARYVTGYLLVGEGVAGEASHAWAEIYVGSLGWIGFDAANRSCPDDRYVRLGSGRDAQDAAPIRGISRGGVGGETMDVQVSVAVQQ